jgi:CRISPR-associated protein Csm3
MPIKLIEIEEIKGTLKVLESGLRIGGSSDTAGIGETDNPIIRHPITKVPYVPGSSIKGKIRSLLELRDSQQTQNTGKPCDCGKCIICSLFGTHNPKSEYKTPTRLLFRDCHPNNSTLKKWESVGQDSEIKNEVIIDRKTNTAAGTGPRKTERIPAYSEFDFAMSIRIFEGDAHANILKYLAGGFELLGRDYLGGYGSRGYGRVAFFAEDGKLLSKYLRERADSLT